MKQEQSQKLPLHRPGKGLDQELPGTVLCSPLQCLRSVPFLSINGKASIAGYLENKTQMVDSMQKNACC